MQYRFPLYTDIFGSQTTCYVRILNTLLFSSQLDNFFVFRFTQIVFVEIRFVLDRRLYRLVWDYWLLQVLSK